MFKDKNKKNLFYGLLLLGLLLVSLLIYKVAGASTGDNDLKISSARITSIKTGSGDFNNDGLNYDQSNSQSYSLDSSYIAGADSNANNRIVRSFDTIEYDFTYKLDRKSGSDDLDNRKVYIIVTLSDEEAKYVTFEKNGIAGEVSHTYEFEGKSTYEEENDKITLYVLGAPNGSTISPKFTIKESTDQDEGISIGNVGNNIYYSYDEDSFETVADFMNRMPTVVSSKEGSVSLRVLTTSTDSQKATYENQVGRYITFVIGAKLNGDENGIKGYVMPTGKISFDGSLSHSGNASLVFKQEWGRLYGLNRVEGIEPILVNIPFSTGDSNSKNKEIKSPGTAKVTLKGINTFNVEIEDFNLTYDSVKVGADDGVLEGNDNYVSSIAITAFSPRVASDGTNDLNVSLSTSNGVFSSPSNSNINIADVSATAVNKYYENSDYSFKTGFYDENGKEKLAKETNVNGIVMKNGTGGVSKGTTVSYISEFNYNKTLSNQGFKEVIKIDDNAFRFVPISDKMDYDIEFNCGNVECNIKKDDFEVKYLTGSFANSNYKGRDFSGLNITDELKERASSYCSSEVANLGNLNINQIQNLYGGPCIEANEGVETTYDKIVTAKDEDDKEIVLTKAIIQTKEGVKLPDNISIKIRFNLRVRNVTDLTQTYQVTAVASTSDYDSELVYYGPTISDDENSVCSSNNYKKTIYRGNNIEVGDDSLFGDSLNILHFSSREELSVKNKNSDGSMKTNYSVADNETITYNVKTIIKDYNYTVGADDSWYINSLIVTVNIPKELSYIKDSDLREPISVETKEDGSTVLVYSLPYTKPNMEIPEIQFRTKIIPTLSGSDSAVPITVSSTVKAKNINGEIDNSIIGLLSDEFTIYATGLDTVIVEQQVGEQGTVVEKNEEFSYILTGYNNTNEDIDNYTIVDVLPNNKDERSSKINGAYSTKVSIPASLARAKVYCTKDETSSITKDLFSSNINWEECNIKDDFVEGITAIKITDISVARKSYIGKITLTLKPKGNAYSNTYNNNIEGVDKTHAKTKSNTIKVKVVSRKISGKVFLDVTGEGIKDGNEKYISKVPVTLYSLGEENELTKVAETETDANGYYEFKDLDKGRYKIRISYDANKYDLTLRYATEDTAKDSDAYKISDKGEAEINSKRVPDDPNGIRLTKNVTSVTNMDAGFIPRRSFGFALKKYITKIDLSYNGSVSTMNYNNQSSVSISVRNSLHVSAKVYYGIAITNDSTQAGYVNLIQEDIPQGMFFDRNYPENQDWFEVNGILRSSALEDVLIEPGETKYLQISLYLPQREEAGTFLNTVSILETTPYEPEELAPDKKYENTDEYNIGDALSYAGVDWHVIGISNREDGSKDLTLIADSGTISTKMSHTPNENTVYKWSESQINKYLNASKDSDAAFIKENSLDLPKLNANVICDDASGLDNRSYGGELASEGLCQTGFYYTSKVRLLTLKEYSSIVESSIEDITWLLGENDFWLQNSDYISPEYLQKYINVYNSSFEGTPNAEILDRTNTGIKQQSVYNKAMYISTDNQNKTDIASNKKEVRPVISINTNNIVAE